MEFEGTRYVESEPFTVGVGPAYRLELENDIFAYAIISSSPFKEQVTKDTVEGGCAHLMHNRSRAV